MTGNPIQSARLADTRGHVLGAIAHFEAALRSGGATAADYLDLAVLYMECTDLGFAAYHRISDELRARAETRALDVLAEAKKKFPEVRDIEFWEIYISWIVWCTEPDIDAIRGLDKTGACEIVALLLVQFDPSPRNKLAAARLLESVRGVNSTRARYVTSVLESALLTPETDAIM